MKKNKANIIKAISLSLLIIFFIAEAVTFYWGMVYSRNGLARLRIATYQNFSMVRTNIFGIDGELKKLHDELKLIVNPQDDDFSKALFICNWVANQVKAKGEGDISASNRTPYSILNAMRQNNTGATCGYRALLYLGALKSMNLEARMLTLIKADARFTHATTEVLIGNEWVLLGSTFNVYFTINGKLASAAELHRTLLSNSSNFEVRQGYKSASVLAYGSPQDLLDYFYYVSIYERRHLFAWQALPVLQYFFGVSEVILEGSPISPNTIATRNLLSLAYNFIFPVLFTGSLATFVAMSKRKNFA